MSIWHNFLTQMLYGETNLRAYHRRHPHSFYLENEVSCQYTNLKYNYSPNLIKNPLLGILNTKVAGKRFKKINKLRVNALKHTVSYLQATTLY